MSLPQLSDATIRSNATSKSFERGQSYYRSGAVYNLVQRGQTFQANVEGNDIRPYRVTLGFDAGGLTQVFCSCPYDYGGWCKHIVATTLAVTHEPEKIEIGSTLEQLLDRLNWQQTQSLVQALVAEHPDLLELIDRQVNLLTEPEGVVSTPLPIRQTTVKPAPYRHKMREILRGAVDTWESGWDDNSIGSELEELIADAAHFMAQQDGNNALVILKAITETCVQEWNRVEDYGYDFYEVEGVLDRAWTEAILTAELTPEQKTDVEVELVLWQDQLGASWEMSLAALSQGWDDPQLQQVFQGVITEQGVWIGEAPDFADELTTIRLAILDRQERYQDYLYLANAEGQIEAYLTMLARLGRTEEAISAAQKQMENKAEALALAKALRQQGEMEQALAIARTGLALPEEVTDWPMQTCAMELAIWTSELAEGLGDTETALSATVDAFKRRPSLELYEKTKTFAGEHWSTLQSDLLKYLRHCQLYGMQEAKVTIFLQEQLLDDAIATVDSLSAYESRLIMQVMDAVTDYQPDWVIQKACQYAETIMDQGKAKNYTLAVHWLRRAKAAYLASGCQAQWTAYYQEILQTHHRKRKLMGLLKEL